MIMPEQKVDIVKCTLCFMEFSVIIMHRTDATAVLSPTYCPACRGTCVRMFCVVLVASNDDKAVVPHGVRKELKLDASQGV